jgi:hypothetical protein
MMIEIFCCECFGREELIPSSFSMPGFTRFGDKLFECVKCHTVQKLCGPFTETVISNSTIQHMSQRAEQQMQNDYHRSMIKEQPYERS